MNSDTVFNDAGLIAEMHVRDALTKAIEEKTLYMAITAALIKKLGGLVTLHDTDILMDATIFTAAKDQHTFEFWVEGTSLVEEVDEAQQELPFE